MIVISVFINKHDSLFYFLSIYLLCKSNCLSCSHGICHLRPCVSLLNADTYVYKNITNRFLFQVRLLHVWHRFCLELDISPVTLLSHSLSSFLSLCDLFRSWKFQTRLTRLFAKTTNRSNRNRKNLSSSFLFSFVVFVFPFYSSLEALLLLHVHMNKKKISCVFTRSFRMCSSWSYVLHGKYRLERVKG
jgi:hypothetical protein